MFGKIGNRTSSGQFKKRIYILKTFKNCHLDNFKDQVLWINANIANIKTELFIFSHLLLIFVDPGIENHNLYITGAIHYRLSYRNCVGVLKLYWSVCFNVKLRPFRKTH